MIEIKNLSKSYGPKLVLNNLNLTIPDETIFGLVGINGAGKSTLLRIMAGVYQGEQGQVIYDGMDVYDNPLVKKSLFFLPDDPFYAFNTKIKDLVTFYQVFHQFDLDVFNELISVFKLPSNATINNFSKGMKRQLFIALAVATKPKYLLLDEAFDGLDPLARLTLKRRLIVLASDNKSTIIISSHSLRELEDICDSYGLIDRQKIASSGQIAEMMKNINKYQVAFAEPIPPDMFKDFDRLSEKIEGRIAQLVIRGDEALVSKQLQALSPLLIDKIAINFEELFIYEVEGRGYLK